MWMCFSYENDSTAKNLFSRCMYTNTYTRYSNISIVEVCLEKILMRICTYSMVLRIRYVGWKGRISALSVQEDDI